MKRKNKPSLRFQSLEFRHLLTTVGFSTFEEIDFPSTWGLTVATTGDLDGDDLPDLIYATQPERRISWLKNVGNNLVENIPHAISNEIFNPSDVVVSDVDGDGDNDVIASFSGTECDLIACRPNYRIEWFENLNGKGEFGAARQISEGRAGHIVVGDLDNDGDDDLLSSFSGIGWFENVREEGRFEFRQLLDGGSADDFVIGDLDGDHDLDVVVANRRDQIVWFENLDSDGSFSENRLIAELDRAKDLALADFDSDGDADIAVVYFKSSGVYLYSNRNGLGDFDSGEVIAPLTAIGEKANSVDAVDIDNDGNLDVAFSVKESLGPYRLSWLEYDEAEFSEELVIATVPRNLQLGGQGFYALVADFDNGGDSDLLSYQGNGGSIKLFQNTQNAFVFVESDLVAGPSTAESAVAADVDGDADLDLVYVSRYRLSWRANLGLGEFGSPQMIDDIFEHPIQSLEVADIDGDKDLDIVIGTAPFLDDCESPCGMIQWYENSDGEGEFAQPIVVDRLNARSLEVVDIDGDDDNDIVTTAEVFFIEDNYFGLRAEIRWYENTDGTGDFSKSVTLDDNPRIRSISTADLDEDGDIDIAAGLVWYENADGTFLARELDGLGGHVQARDIDNDGDVDIVSLDCDFLTSDCKGLVSVNKNLGDGVFTKRINAVRSEGSINNVALQDLDHDGDLDLIVASRTSVDVGNGYYSEIQLGWHENRPGGFFGIRNVIFDQVGTATGLWEIASVIGADLDGDGDTDIIVTSSESERIVCFKNEFYSQVVGDVNHDGIFNSKDLVLVFAAAEYEDDVVGNSTFEEGDWNGDGEFNSSDLVLAFQRGDYVAAVAR